MLEMTGVTDLHRSRWSSRETGLKVGPLKIKFFYGLTSDVRGLISRELFGVKKREYHRSKANKE